MLNMPRVPAPKQGFRFEGVEQHQLKQALAAEICETIEALIKNTYVLGWLGVFYKFRSCIEPGEVRDLARLPYQVGGPNDTAGTKIGCVFARLGWVIRLYWGLCLEGKHTAVPIRQYLDDLRRVAACGIEKCKMVGNPREGYWLEIV